MPFLDVDFLNEAFSFDPAEKMFPGEDKRMEKYVIRCITPFSLLSPVSCLLSVSPLVQESV